MAIDFEVLKTSLYCWANDNTPSTIPVIFSNQNSPRPSTPYVSLLINSFVQIGNDYSPRPTDSTSEIDLAGDREFTLEVQVFGGSHLQILENLRSSLQKETVLNELRSKGVVFVLQNPITDISAVFDTRFEQRATMDILFRISQTIEDDHGAIETVELKEKFVIGEDLVYKDKVTISAN